MRHEALAGDVVKVGEILAAPPVTRLAVRPLLDDELAILADELPLHVAAEVEITAVGDPLELAELPRREEREGVFDVGGADGIVGELVGVVLAELELPLGEPKGEIPPPAPVAPVAIPFSRFRRLAEELDLHLLELARAEGEVARRDLVAEALADLADAEGDLHARGVDDVLEVHEDPLGRLRPEEGPVVVVAGNGADPGLEHEVELARSGERARLARIGAEGVGEGHRLGVDRCGERFEPREPLDLLDLAGADAEALERPGHGVRQGVVSRLIGDDEQLLAAVGSPPAVEVIETVALLRLPAVDHPVVEEIEVAGALPDLRVHDDRAVEPGHLVGLRGAGRRGELIVAGDHVVPPGILEIPLQGHPKRPVIPKSVQAAVDLARLKDETAALGERHDLVHPRLVGGLVHGSPGGSGRGESGPAV